MSLYAPPARRNDTVELVRSLPWNQAKQNGRRYGPPPKKPRGPGAGRMDDERRRQLYRRGGRNMTARQLATWWRKTLQKHALTLGIGRANGKGRATPKRGAR